jgi:cytidine deaminase
MKFCALTGHDHTIIEETESFLKKHYLLNRHMIAASLLTGTGKRYTALNLACTLGRANVCAESTALAQAIAQQETEFSTLVVVRHVQENSDSPRIKLVTPCGICREMLYEYAPELYVIITHMSTLKKVSIRDLLPLPYTSFLSKS